MKCADPKNREKFLRRPVRIRLKIRTSTPVTMEDTFANYVFQGYTSCPNDTVLSVYRGEEAIAKLLFIQGCPSLSNYTAQERAEAVFFTYQRMLRRYPCYVWHFAIGSSLNNGIILGHKVTRHKWDAYKALYDL